MLPQLFSGIRPTTRKTEEIFDRDVTYWLCTSEKLKKRYDELTDKTELTAKVAVFFGVGPEPNLFGLRSYFSSTITPVLVGVYGIRERVARRSEGVGRGMSTAVIGDCSTMRASRGFPSRSRCWPATAPDIAG